MSEAQAGLLETEGLAANTAGDSASAREKFLAAYNLSPKPKYLLSAANMCLKIGANSEACRYYQELDAMDLPPKLKQVVQTKLADERIVAAAAAAHAASAPSAATLELRARAGAARAEAEAARHAAEEEAAQIKAEMAAEAEAANAHEAEIVAAEAVAAEAESRAERMRLEAEERARQREARSRDDDERTRLRREAEEAKQAAARAKEELERERQREADKAREATARQALEEDRLKQLESEMRAKIEKEERDKMEKRMAEETAARHAAEESARNAAEAAANAAKAAAAKVREVGDARRKAAEAEASAEAEERSRALEEEMARARASMAANFGGGYGEDGGSSSGMRGSHQRALSCDDLGLPLSSAPRAAVTIGESTLGIVDEDGMPGGAGDAVDGGGDGDFGAGSHRQRLAKTRVGRAAQRVGGVARRASSLPLRAVSVLPSSKRKRLLKETQRELETSSRERAKVQRMLDDALAAKKSLETKNKQLYERTLAAQEGAAKAISDARVRGTGGGDAAAKLEAAEAENAGLIKQIEELIQSREAAKVAASAAIESAEVAKASAAARVDQARAAAAMAPRNSNASVMSGVSAISGVSVSPSLASTSGGLGVGMSKTDEAQALRLRAKGVLLVTLKHARNLMSADANGLSDPYVIISGGGAKKTSKTIKKTLDPTWNEEMQLKGKLSDFLTQVGHLARSPHMSTAPPSLAAAP